MTGLPSYVTPADIAEAHEPPTKDLRRKMTREIRKRLRRAGILEADGPHRFHVAMSRLRERLPEYYERVLGFAAMRLNDAQEDR